MRNSPEPNQPAALLAQLAFRAQQGDHLALESLLLSLEPSLKRILLRRTGGRAELAEELTQKTRIAVWQAVSEKRYDPLKAAISTFVYAVANKLWLQHLRSSRAQTRTQHGFEELFGHGPLAQENPAEALHAAELLDAARDCLSQTKTPGNLTPQERRIVLGLARGESERSLGLELGVAASTVHARKQRAYKKLRRCLQSKGFSLESPERESPRGE